MNSHSMALSKVKNLMFDLGGVVIDIQRQRAVDEFLKLGVTNIDDLLGLYIQSGIFLQLEGGELNTQEFHEELRRHTNLPITDGQIDDAFCQFIVGIPVHRLRALEQLHNQYRLFVLSNTNPIMFEGKIANEFAQDGHDINYYFDGVTVSYRAKANKPAKKIFDYAVRTMNIVPEETLFLDDSQQNVDVATACGFQSILIPPGVEFIEVLKQLKLCR